MKPTRHTGLFGMFLTALGLICVAGSVALLGWRLLNPERAVVLPPGYADTPEATLTPGSLSTPLAPPAPTGTTPPVILPVSEKSSPAPGHRITQEPNPTASQTPTPSITPFSLPIQPPAIPDRILIDAIGLDAPVVPVGLHPVELDGQVFSQWDVPNTYAVGWHQNSAPLGQPGNTVLNGHHNIYGEVFRDLVALVPGDKIVLESAGRRYEYVVAQTITLAEEGQPLAIRRENARWILPTTDERVTLITCWPYTAHTHRLIVVALPAAQVQHADRMP